MEPGWKWLLAFYSSLKRRAIWKGKNKGVSQGHYIIKNFYVMFGILNIPWSLGLGPQVVVLLGTKGN